MFTLKNACRLSLVLSLLLLIFVALFIQNSRAAKARQERIDELVAACIADAHRAFDGYLSSPSEGSYRAAVSSFYALKVLYPESDCYDNDLFIALHQVYAKLLFISPESSDLQILADALEILESNSSDIRARVMLQTFAGFREGTTDG